MTAEREHGYSGNLLELWPAWFRVPLDESILFFYTHTHTHTHVLRSWNYMSTLFYGLKSLWCKLIHPEGRARRALFSGVFMWKQVPEAFVVVVDVVVVDRLILLLLLPEYQSAVQHPRGGRIGVLQLPVSSGRTAALPPRGGQVSEDWGNTHTNTHTHTLTADSYSNMSCCSGCVNRFFTGAHRTKIIFS